MSPSSGIYALYSGTGGTTTVSPSRGNNTVSHSRVEKVTCGEYIFC